MNGFKDKLIELITAMLSSFDGVLGRASGALTSDVFNQNGLFSNVWMVVGNPSNPGNGTVLSVLQGVAYTIIAICFLIEFLRITVNMSILKLEFGFKVFAKFVIAKGTIDFAPVALKAIYTTIAVWVDKVAGNNAVTSGTQLAREIKACLENQTWGAVLGLFLAMSVVFLIVQGVGWLTLVMAYARAFEIFLLIAVSPIPCAFMPLEDSRITKKFFMNFAGVCLQGVFILISMKLFNAVAASLMTTHLKANASAGDILGACSMLLISALVLAVMVFKSGSMAKGLLDAN